MFLPSRFWASRLSAQEKVCSSESGFSRRLQRALFLCRCSSMVWLSGLGWVKRFHSSKRGSAMQEIKPETRWWRMLLRLHCSCLMFYVVDLLTWLDGWDRVQLVVTLRTNLQVKLLLQLTCKWRFKPRKHYKTECCRFYLNILNKNSLLTERKKILNLDWPCWWNSSHTLSPHWRLSSHSRHGLQTSAHLRAIWRNIDTSWLKDRLPLVKSGGEFVHLQNKVSVWRLSKVQVLVVQMLSEGQQELVLPADVSGQDERAQLLLNPPPARNPQIYSEV